MSIITTAQAVPSRLFSIYAALLDSETGELREALESWSTPPSLSGRGADEDGESSTTLFSNTLIEARNLRLVEEVDGKLRLPPDVRGATEKRDAPEDNFRRYLMSVLFDSEQATQAKQEGFMMALAWFLAKNPLRPMSFSEAPQIQLKAELGDHSSRTELTSLNRYQNFLYWAWYLGFATMVGDERNTRRAVPDPLLAIEGCLSAIFSSDMDLPIDTFLNRLAGVFPVLDGGAVREEYLGMLRDRPQDERHRVLKSTSLALQRLADQRKIVLRTVADAPARVLDFEISESRVSHISLVTLS